MILEITNADMRTSIDHFIDHDRNDDRCDSDQYCGFDDQVIIAIIVVIIHATLCIATDHFNGWNT